MSAVPVLDSREFILEDAQATHALGARIAVAMKRGDVVCLSGGLGAGKTTLARGAVAAWTEGAETDVPSPTYTLVQTYQGPKGELWHMDLYRLKHAEEAFELGLEEAFSEAACLIEWPERLGGALPADRLELELHVAGAGRRAHATAKGAWKGRLDAL